MSDKRVRVRFAPSPTGPLHMGGMRTALFNYLFARKHGGDFILRIEDTDQSRYVPGAEEYIINSLEWCKLKIDEGVSAGGDFGPYRQSGRKEIYKQYAEKLLVEGHAYIAFDTQEELEGIRSEYERRKETFTYCAGNRKGLNNSLTLPSSEVKKRIEAGMPYVTRFKIPENEELRFRDIIRGEVVVNTSALDDKVLFKSDGLPTYHLANVVDDHLMQISHVIRGEEWLPSLPLHILLYRAFGWESEMPFFAHMPLTLKPDGKGKLSKRDGDRLGFPVFPLEWTNPDTGEKSSGYRESGYYPEAFINIIAFLGWNPGTTQEIFSLKELEEAFSLERVVKAGSGFDPDKAKWYNHQYLQRKNNLELAQEFIPLLEKEGMKAEISYVEKVIRQVKERVNFVSELWNQSWFFFKAPVEYDTKTVQKHWKKNTPDTMRELGNLITAADNYNSQVLEQAVKKWITEKNLRMGEVMNPFRLSIVGAALGPHLFDIIELIGKEETLRRIDAAIERIPVPET